MALGSVLFLIRRLQVRFLPRLPTRCVLEFLGFGFAVLARRRVQARVSQAESLDRRAAEDMRVDNLADVGLGDVSVPDGVGLDHDIWAVLALIEAARLVRAYFPL